MRADPPLARWAGLLLAMALLSTGCMSLTPPPSQATNLRYTPRVVAAPASAEGPSETLPHALASPPPSPPEPEVPERPHRRRGSREAVTGADPGGVAGAFGGTLIQQARHRRPTRRPVCPLRRLWRPATAMD